MKHTDRAKQLRTVIEKAVMSLDDAVASTAAELFPNLKGDSSFIKAGTRIN
jgi:hypothetical protein